jgi:hypothetical protein
MKTKAFDCVQMKRQAQRELRNALEGKSPEAQAAEIERRAAASPIWRELVRMKPRPTRARRAGSSQS